MAHGPSTGGGPAQPQPGPDATTATRRRLPREIRVLAVASFLIAIGFGLVAPTLPVFVRGFDVGITAASLVISVFALSRLLFAPVSGAVVGRFGELPAYLSGLAVVAVSNIGCAFATEYWQLLVLRLLGGVGSTLFTVSAVSLLVRLSPPDMRGRASGVWATAFLLGNIIGPLAGGVLLGISLRAPFLVYAAVLIGLIVVTGPMLARRRSDGPAPVDDAPPARVADALRHPAFRASLVGGFVNGWMVFGVRIALIPLLVVEALRLPEAWGGIALTVFAAGNAATLTLAGRWADTRGRRPPLLLGLAVSGVTTGLLGFFEQPAVFLALCLISGLGSGLVNPPLSAVVADVIGNGSRGGPVLAGFQMAGDLGAVIGPVVAGALAETSGYGAAFALTGVLGLLAMIPLFRMAETLPGRAPTPARVSPR